MWDTLLRRGHCQDGNGQPQQCKTLIPTTETVFRVVFFVIFLYLTAHKSSFQRKYTQEFEDIKDQIYFMQTETPVYDTNKKARIAASEVSRHKHTHKGIIFLFIVFWKEYFYRYCLMWKTRQRVDPCLRAECESTHWVHYDAGTHHIVPTHALRDWEIYICFTVTAQIQCIVSLVPSNKI